MPLVRTKIVPIEYALYFLYFLCVPFSIGPYNTSRFFVVVVFCLFFFGGGVFFFLFSIFSCEVSVHCLKPVTLFVNVSIVCCVSLKGNHC